MGRAGRLPRERQSRLSLRLRRAAGTSSPSFLARLPRIAAGLALAAALLAALLPAGEARAQTEVPANWSLVPDGLSVGDEFRLLFVTSQLRDGTSTDIADYNTLVQNRAAAGHTGIRSYSSGFRAVASTASVDARDNTSTTGTGVRIYWLNGNKVADNYADFYDATWDDEANRKNELGNNNSQAFVWTGSAHNGTELIETGTSRAMGTAQPVFGQPNKSGTTNGPLSGSGSTSVHNNFPLYGISEVFEVVASVPSAPPNLTATSEKNSVTLTWGTATPNGAVVDAYRTRYKVQNGDFGDWVSLHRSVRSHTYSGLTHETTYVFEVQARNAKGWGGTSSVTHATAANSPRPRPISRSRSTIRGSTTSGPPPSRSRTTTATYWRA